ncbi:MAG: hybrid sensor histidine kinase/response regulator [Terriglobia bacterium]|nr:MAG: hybrid sensor histidine kinase/response regulator [Terriglobia bacterium]
MHTDLYRLLVEHSLGLMCIHDLEGVLISINPAVAYSLGYSPEDGSGRNLRDFLAPAVRRRFDDYLRRIQENGHDSGMMRLLAKDGSERLWMYRNTLYQRQEGDPWVLGHALDITERVRIEKELQEAQGALRKSRDELAARVEERTAELRAANQRLMTEIQQREQAEEELLRARKLESLGVLAGGIAHDFNNFLTVVQGNTELAKLQLESGHPVKHVLEQISEACQRAAFLSSQLLTFAKGGSPVRQIASVAKVIRDAVNLVRSGTAISFEVHLAQDLWCAEIDAGQVGQVLHNILLNARQATVETGIIEVRAENIVVQRPGVEPEPCVRISVRDYGSGIPAEILPRIFDPYFTTKPSGSGLGLAMAYSIISKHGGHISVASKLGDGTVFTIELPASQATPPAQEPVTEILHHGSGRILVMDDEEHLRVLLERVLAAIGYEVRCASDGAEAIAIYEAETAVRRHFDAIILDLTVRGGMGGLETATRLRELGTTAKLIVSSGYSDAPVVADAPQFGFDAVIPKPWTPIQLSEVIRRVLVQDPERKK